jgi:hypothetical protein
MLNPITPAAAQLTDVAPAHQGAAARSGKAFSVILREQPAAPAATAGGPLAPAAAAGSEGAAPSLAVRHMERIVDSQRQLERSMRRALRGDDFSPQQLLALQFQVQTYSLEVEAVSRVVDKITGAVKTAMQTQV